MSIEDVPARESVVLDIGSYRVEPWLNVMKSTLGAFVVVQIR
jgi:hypothetical protein